MAWSSEGLKRVAELVESQVIRTSQRSLAQQANVSQQTIANLIVNLHNHDGRIVKEPKLETLNKVAPHVTNPATGQPFTPQEFFAIATNGYYNLNATQTAPEEAIYVCLENPGVKLVKAARGNMSVTRFAQKCELKPEVMKEILEGRLPTKKECMFMAAAIFEDKDTRRLMEAYGYRFKPAQATRNGVSG